MKIIFLSGNSIKNKVWIEEIQKRFKDSFQSTEILYYKHWKTGEDDAEISHESKELTKLVKDKDDYCIFAKSIGTFITLKTIKEKKIKPKKLIFLGVPLKHLKEKGLIKDAITAFGKIKVPILFIQNSNDPYASYKELVKFLDKCNIKEYETFEFKGKNTHDYEDYKKLKELTKKFIY